MLRIAFMHLLTAMLAAGTVSSTLAQDYPSRTVKIITNVSVGGTFDIFARALAVELHNRLGRPVIIEPRPGGNFLIAGRACAESEPDGHTLCALSGETLVHSEFLYKNLPYSPRKDFAPVTNLFFNTQVLVVNASLNVSNLDELAALAKAKPNTLAYVAPGLAQRVFIERFKKQHGIDIVNVPFRGGGEAVAGILQGTTPIAFFGGANFVSFINEGKFIGLAVDAPERTPLFPKVPTLKELGYQENPVRTYLAIVVPAATPKPIIDRLHKEITGILNEPDFRQRNLINRGLEPTASTPEGLAAYMDEDRAAFEKIVRESGIQAQ
jgi:tripartite-type tricarboxylate transporter receptor subunit TctC